MNIKKNLITIAICASATTLSFAQSNTAQTPARQAGGDSAMASGVADPSNNYPSTWDHTWQRDKKWGNNYNSLNDQQRSEYRAHRKEMRDKWSKMSPAEKSQAHAAYKQNWNSMNPEQQQAYKTWESQNSKYWSDMYKGGSK